MNQALVGYEMRYQWLPLITLFRFITSNKNNRGNVFLIQMTWLTIRSAPDMSYRPLAITPTLATRLAIITTNAVTAISTSPSTAMPPNSPFSFRS